MTTDKQVHGNRPACVCMEEAAKIFGWPNYYLPFLVRAGMLARTPRGRVATAQAWTHLGMTPPNGVSGLGQAGLFD